MKMNKRRLKKMTDEELVFLIALFKKEETDKTPFLRHVARWLSNRLYKLADRLHRYSAGMPRRA